MDGWMDGRTDVIPFDSIRFHFIPLFQSEDIRVQFLMDISRDFILFG